MPSTTSEARSGNVARYQDQMLTKAKEALEREARRRSEFGNGNLTREGKELCVVGAAQEELAVIDRHRLEQGLPKLEQNLSRQLLKGVLGATLGLGPVQEILEDPSVEEVLGRWDYLVVYRSGRSPEEIRGSRTPWSSQQEMVEWLAYAARTQGLTERSFNPGSPLLVMRLGPGLRLAAQREVGEQVTFALRRNVLGRSTIEQLGAFGMFHPVVGQFLKAAMRLSEIRIVFAGATGAGKTTLARACLAELQPSEHVIVMEDTAEIDLFDPDYHPNVESWEVREANVEGQGEVSLADLVRHSLRHRPDWNVVGEVRDGQAATPMVAAMTAGMSSLTTVHAKSAVGALDKLQLYLGMGDEQMGASIAQMQLSLAIDFVVHVKRNSATGRRSISEIIQVAGFDHERCTVNTLYRERPDGPVGANVFTEEMAERLEAVGFDPRQFTSWGAVA